MFEFINNAILIVFVLLAFPVGPLLIALGSGPRPGEYIERQWSVG